MSTAPFQRKGRFWRGNLHTHSTRSDGRLPPEAVADFYKGAGYDFLALTDHFWEHCGYPITDTRPLRTKAFTTLHRRRDPRAPDGEGARLAHRRPRPAVRLRAARRAARPCSPCAGARRRPAPSSASPIRNGTG